MDEKKLELIERASAVFMKFGIKSVTMDDLSRELGISKKTFYKYFDDKNDLVYSTIDAKINMDKAACIACTVSTGNAIEALVSISRFVIEHFSKVNPTVFYDLKKHHPDAWKLMDQHRWEFVLENIHSNILKGIEEGLYRENLNSKIIARYYVASFDIIMDAEVYPWPEFKPDNIVAQIHRFQIRGMASDKGLLYIKENFNSEINE
ncbi:MAG: AcrR family transcriptional regulator [Flavobacteriaceae bacterium]|jgi:AcrR family transcriptional regulator